VLSTEETRVLLDRIDVNSIAGLRDRALIGVMGYSFAQVGAVVDMKVENYYRRATAGGFGCTKRAASGTRCPPTTTPRLMWTRIWQRPRSLKIAKARSFAV